MVAKVLNTLCAAAIIANTSSSFPSVILITLPKYVKDVTSQFYAEFIDGDLLPRIAINPDGLGLTRIELKS